MNENEKLNFLKNGFELVDSENNSIFIAYQAISVINEIQIDLLYGKYYSIESRSFIENQVGKYCYFIIWLIDGRNITVSFKSGERYFRRLGEESKHRSFIQKIIKGPFESGLDEESFKWLNNKNIDMEESVRELTIARNSLISNFNNWINDRK